MNWLVIGKIVFIWVVFFVLVGVLVVGMYILYKYFFNRIKYIKIFELM